MKILKFASFAAVATSVVLASPITFSMTTASGTLRGTIFTNAAITVTSLADASNVFTTPGFASRLNYEVVALTSPVSIEGFAMATFTNHVLARSL